MCKQWQQFPRHTCVNCEGVLIHNWGELYVMITSIFPQIWHTDMSLITNCQMIGWDQVLQILTHLQEVECPGAIQPEEPLPELHSVNWTAIKLSVPLLINTHENRLSYLFSHMDLSNDSCSSSISRRERLCERQRLSLGVWRLDLHTLWTGSGTSRLVAFSRLIDQLWRWSKIVDMIKHQKRRDSTSDTEMRWTWQAVLTL